MQKKIVAVIFGGTSTEHEISKISAGTIISNIPQDKYLVMPIYITKEGKWLLYDGIIDNISNIQWEKYGTPVVLSPDATHNGLLRIVNGKVKNMPVDIVFPVLHGKYGEDGSIQGLCELAGIPYVGANIVSSAVCMDKAFTKIIVKSIGIAQADHIMIRKKDFDENPDEIMKTIRYKIGYPCFVKPANAGSSVGISKAKSKSELEKAIWEASDIDKKIIIEKAVNGRELECAVLGNDNAEVSGVGEIISSSDFYDFDAKYNDTGSETIINPELPDDIKEDIRSAAVSIYTALDCSGMARVDFFYDTEKNKIIFNEINTIPGFTSISMYPKLWETAGVSLPSLIDRLIESGFNR